MKSRAAQISSCLNLSDCFYHAFSHTFSTAQISIVNTLPTVLAIPLRQHYSQQWTPFAVHLILAYPLLIAAFNTVQPNILIRRLGTSFGVTGLVSWWQDRHGYFQYPTHWSSWIPPFSLQIPCQFSCRWNNDKVQGAFRMWVGTDVLNKIGIRQ